MKEDVKYTISLDDKFTNKMKGMEGAASNFESKMMSAGSSMMKYFAGTAIVAGIYSISKKIIGLGADLEQTEISFSTMMGSAKKGKALMEALQQFAVVTPFTSEQTMNLSKQLMAMGIEADKIIPTMRTLGDISSGVGMEKLPNLVLAFGQVKAATRLTGMDLRQFIEAGVPLLDALAKQTGKSVAYIKDTMITKGQVSFQMVEKAMQSMTGEGGKFFNLMEKQSQSASGLWSTFVDKMQLAGGYLGRRFEPTTKKVEKGMIGLADKMLDMVKVPVSETLRQEQIQLNVLANRLMNANTKEGERKTIIKEINEISPELLKNLNTEKLNISEISTRLREANIQYENKLILQKKQEEIDASAKEATSRKEAAMDKEAELQKKINEAAIALKGTNAILGKDYEDQIRILTDLSRSYLTGTFAKKGYFGSMKLGTGKTIRGELDMLNELLLAYKHQSNITKKLTLDRNAMAKKFNIPLLSEGGNVIGADKSLTESADMLSSITAQSPKIFNINIEKLVETINNNVNNITEGMSQTKRIVTEALIDSLNQTQIVATQ
jgi:tape measure domain-containing protein